jgi:hypothetical protein
MDERSVAREADIALLDFAVSHYSMDDTPRKRNALR